MTERQSTTILLFQHCLAVGLVSARECDALSRYWGEISTVNASERAEFLTTFIRTTFVGPPTRIGAVCATRGEEILAIIGEQQQQMQESQRQISQVSRHQLLEDQKAQQAREAEIREQELAKQQKEAATQRQKDKQQRKQQPKAAQAISYSQPQFQQFQQVQFPQPQPHQHQQTIQQAQIQQLHLPDIFAELIEKDAPLDRNKGDPNLIFTGSTTSQKLIEGDFESMESEQAKRLMREGFLESVAVGDGFAMPTASNWYDTNLVDYTQLQRAYQRVQEQSGLVPTGQAMRLLSKAVQAHAAKVLEGALHQANRRTSTTTMDDYCKLYVLAAENPAVRSELYSMKWGPDVLGALKAEEEAGKVAGKRRADVEVQRVKAAAQADAARSAEASAGGGGGRKRKAAGDAGEGAPFWERDRLLCDQNLLTLGDMAKLFFVEDCVPGAKKSAAQAAASMPLTMAPAPSSSTTAPAASSSSSVVATTTAFAPATLVAAASSSGVGEAAAAGAGAGEGSLADDEQARAAQRSKILASLAAETPIVRAATERRILKSDVLVALGDLKAARANAAFLRGMVFAKEKDHVG